MPYARLHFAIAYDIMLKNEYRARKEYLAFLLPTERNAVGWKRAMGKVLGKCVFAFVGQTNPLRLPPLSGKEGKPTAS